MLEVCGISKSYNQKKVLNDFSFKVKRGEIFGLVGLNGSGKTTTFRILLQLLEADNGEILLDKVPLSPKDRLRFGYLPEERTLYKDQSVLDQLILLGKLKQMEVEKIKERVNYLKELLEFPYELDRPIKQLSKGNQQKVQIMSALLHDPEVLIFDEPFSGMDPYNVEILKKIFLDLKKMGKIILLSTHRIDHVESFCNALAILKEGKVVVQGNINELKQQDERRLITINDDIPLFKLKDLFPDTNILKEGKLIKIYVENEELAYLKIQQIIKKYHPMNISYGTLNLAEMFLLEREANHE